MIAAKEKTFSPSRQSTFNWSPRGTYVQAAATSNDCKLPTIANAEPVVSRFTQNDFRARKSKKSPIGSIVKNQFTELIQNHQRPRENTRPNRLQLRRSHLAPEMSQYRGYFVPGATDALGLAAIKCQCYSHLSSFSKFWTRPAICTGLATTCCKEACKHSGGYRPTGAWVVAGSREDEMNQSGGKGAVRAWLNSKLWQAWKEAGGSASWQKQWQRKWGVIGTVEVGLKYGFKVTGSGTLSPQQGCVSISAYAAVYGNFQAQGPFPLTTWVIEPSFAASGSLKCCKGCNKNFDILRDCIGDIKATLGIKVGLRGGVTKLGGGFSAYVEGGGWFGGTYSFRKDEFRLKGYAYARSVLEAQVSPTLKWSERGEVRWGSDVDF